VSAGPSPGFAAFIGMGVTSALCVAIGVGGGYWLDTVFHTGAALTFAGLALGLIAAAVAVYRQLKTLL